MLCKNYMCTYVSEAVGFIYSALYNLRYIRLQFSVVLGIVTIYKRPH